MSDNINLMLLGQTGMGKSALINYLYGQKVVEEGIGKPVTKQGDFHEVRIASPSKPGVTLTFFDSWGLEADQADVWKKAVIDKLNRKLNFERNTMFLGILYCMSYTSARIQDFEISFIKDLIGTGYNVTVVFTNADSNNYDVNKHEFRRRLSSSLPESKYAVIDICSRVITKLGQTVTKQPFGREKLLRQIEEDGYKNFRALCIAKLKKWHDDGIRQADAFKQRYQTKIAVFERDIFQTKPAAAAGLYYSMEQDFSRLWDEIISGVGKTMKLDFEWYKKNSGASFEPDNITAEHVAGVIIKMIPLLGLLYHFAVEKELLQDDLNRYLNTWINDLKKNIDEIHLKTTSELKD
jgi:predicted GTPase